MTIVDLRSDTLTRPSVAMRKCMADADVGDDFYREDPTVTALEEYAADLLQKEAALFVLSGTMGNLVSVRAQVAPGKAVILSETSHLHVNETGHLASICGLTSYPSQTNGGYYDLPSLEARWPLPESNSPPSVLNPALGLICIENTHNGDGGRCVDLDHLQAVAAFANARSIALHVDGARLFNASVFLGVCAAEVVKHVDSVSFCLSKGLAAPGGAIIAGTQDFVEEARHWRQMVGGGMRQAGVLAAAGLMALRDNTERLHEDHENAHRLAEGLAEAGLVVDLDGVHTNIVMAFIPKAFGAPSQLHKDLTRAGVLVLPPKGNRLRFVTHADVSRSSIDQALTRISRVISDRRSNVGA